MKIKTEKYQVLKIYNKHFLTLSSHVPFQKIDWSHRNNSCTLLTWPLPPSFHTYFMDTSFCGSSDQNPILISLPSHLHVCTFISFPIHYLLFFQIFCMTLEDHKSWKLIEPVFRKVLLLWKLGPEESKIAPKYSFSDFRKGVFNCHCWQ